jgi:hypothetical protein
MQVTVCKMNECLLAYSDCTYTQDACMHAYIHTIQLIFQPAHNMLVRMRHENFMLWVNVHTCMYIFIRMYIHICIYSYICKKSANKSWSLCLLLWFCALLECICLHTYMHECIHTYIHTQDDSRYIIPSTIQVLACLLHLKRLAFGDVHIYTRMYVCIYICVYLYTCMHTYAFMYIHYWQI